MTDIVQENIEEEGYVRDESGNLIPDYEMTIKLFDDGDIVNGTIVRIDRDEILLDIGYKSEGVIPIKELSIRKSVDPNEIVSVGDAIDALVMQKEDKDGRLILSKKRAEFEKAWDRVEKLSKDHQPVEGTVIEVVKGGLILDIGLRGFLPASLVDVRRVKDLRQFIGQKLSCLIIEIDRHRNNVVLSRRAVLDEERRQDRDMIMSTIKRGQIVTGKVSSIVDFGAFVDLGGMDGLVHISEISWSHIDHPSDILALNQEIEIKVLDIDQERGRISLGYKQTQENPWRKKLGELKVGESTTGKIIKLVQFGAFVELPNGIEALLHNSEIKKNPDLKLSVGDEIDAKVDKIDEDRRRVNLTLEKAAEETTPAEEVETIVATEETVSTEVKAEDKETVKTATAAASVEEVVLETSKNAKLEAEEVDAKVADKLKKDAAEFDKKTEKEIELKLAKKKIDPEPAEKMPPPEPGSLEDVLSQMKQARADK